MVKTRRRNYVNVTFDEDDDVREISADASDESGADDTRDGGGDSIGGEKIVNGVESSDSDSASEKEKDPNCEDLLPVTPGGVLKRLVALDVRISAAAAVSASPTCPLGCLRPFFKILELSCHGVPWLFLTCLLLLSGEIALLPRHSLLLLLLLVDLNIVGLTKAVFRRSRPAINIEDDVLTVSVDKYSFPSGHATRAIMLLLYLTLNVFTASSCYQTCTIMWASTVVMSRILIGRHHVSDVVAGVIIGALVFLKLSPLLVPVAAIVAETVEPFNQRALLLELLPDCFTAYL